MNYLKVIFRLPSLLPYLFICLIYLGLIFYYTPIVELMILKENGQFSEAVISKGKPIVDRYVGILDFFSFYFWIIFIYAAV